MIYSFSLWFKTFIFTLGTITFSKGNMYLGCLTFFLNWHNSLPAANWQIIEHALLSTNFNSFTVTCQVNVVRKALRPHNQKSEAQISQVGDF